MSGYRIAECWSGRWGALGKGRTKWSPENWTIFPGDVRAKGTPHGKVRGGATTAQSQKAQGQCACGERFWEWVQGPLWNHLLLPTGIIPAKPFPPDSCVCVCARACFCVPYPALANRPPTKTCTHTHRSDARTVEGSGEGNSLTDSGTNLRK